MKITTSIKSLCLAIMFGCSLATQAATLYVNTTGDNNNDCLSWGAACLTVADAVGKAVAGDEIHIAKGIYKIATDHINVDGKNLRFVGGFVVVDGTVKEQGDKFATVFSGDVDNNDNVDARGITTDYTKIDGTNAQRAANIRNANFEFVNMTFTGFKGPVSDHRGAVIFYANSNKAENTLKLDNVAVIGNQSPSLGAVMMYVNSPNTGEFTAKNSLFDGNLGDAGATIALHNNVTKALVENTVFNNNHAKRDGTTWNRGVAALYAQSAATDLTVKNSIFTNNTAEYGAAALFSNGTLTVVNSSFSNNSVANAFDEVDDNVGLLNANICAGAVVVKAKQASFMYNTFYGNSAPSGCAGGIKHTLATAGSLQMLANLVLGNTPNNIDTNNNTINDRGYNIFGFANVSGVNGGFSLSSTSLVPDTNVLVADIVKEVGYFGGRGESVKITANSPARNKIPYDGIPFYGVGRSAGAPFISLEQARGALARSDYQAGTYYFDLGGLYDYDTNDKLQFTPGSGSGVFSTQVDDNGYVLVISGNKNTVAGSFTVTSDLSVNSDSILNRSIFAALDVAEVRITSEVGAYFDANGVFDVYSTDAEVIANLKNLQLLKPNAVTPSGGNYTNVTSRAWFSTENDGDDYYMMFDGTNAACGAGKSYATGDIINSRAVIWGCGTPGMHWTGDREVIDNNIGAVTSSVQDSLGVWVRGDIGLCNGAVETDARGLPRSDRVKAEEPFSHCDIGAFEFNNFYQVDCWDEDGSRPENTISNAHMTWCVNPLENGLTPKDLLDNFGSFYWYWSIALTGLLLWRRQRARH